MPDGVRPPTTGTGFLYDRRDLMQETDGFGGDVDLMYAGATDEIYGDLISEGDGDGLIHFYDAMGSTVALTDGSSGDWHAKRNHRQVNVWKVVSRPSKIPPATRTGSHMATRADLIKLVELVRREPVGSPRRRELFEQLHAGLGLDIERLEIMVGQEGEAEWVVDMAPLMGDDSPSLTRAEMVELVKKIQNAEGSPSELGARVILFERNCVHPAGTDLLYLTDEYFGEDSDPEPEEIADKAMSGK